MSADVLVLGGGLAGVAAAQVLGDAGVRTTLVDRADYHQFQPLLYQVATSQLPAEDVARPLRTIFADVPEVDVVVQGVASASLADRTLVLDDGRRLTAEHVVVAAGARPNFFGVPGAAEHAFPLYSVADAERLRRHHRALVAEAVRTGRFAPADLDIVVVGGGPTGVEVSGAIAELATALRQSDRLPTAGTVHLVDRGAAVLAPFSPKAQAYAHRRLEEVGVDLRLGTGVAAVRPDGVDLTDGTTLATRTVVWAGGESGSAIVQQAGPTPGRGGRLDVRADLGVDGFPGVWAVGDVANIPSGPGPDAPTLPQLGSVAQQSGRWAGHNVLRASRGEDLQPFRYKDKGIMAMIGRNAAVAEVGAHRHEVDGPIAFAAWLGVHAMLLSGVHSRTDAFLSWAWDYFDRDHAATVESHDAPRRIAWGDDSDDVPHIDLGG
ncbi:NAD(P)/FAD-dependent oxidoreductase [Cellulomonas biazotea]|uniref:Pyridine nucleotide-disulfide oxidoreductase n=1 Tax=Cellulomonas biazotea TaxID=1709 RepID=A0A402DUT5_9CELL|nr:FAD-dependent oxidoreductase [Cellulomonas biazotea]GCE77884.1 pyridine nucleotide-disulfide oxidoreductase [Cellulomonas biazotea]